MISRPLKEGARIGAEPTPKPPPSFPPPDEEANRPGLTPGRFCFGRVAWAQPARQYQRRRHWGL